MSTRRRSWLILACLGGLAIAVGSASCSALDSSIHGTGIGAQCANDSDCHAASCVQSSLSSPGAPIPTPNGICETSCNSNSDCPSGSACFGNECQVPMKAHAVWVGVVSFGEGWTLTHQQGLEGAQKQLPYLTFDYLDNVIPGIGAVETTVDDAVKAGANVIILNSLSYKYELLGGATAVAAKYPDVKFLMAATFAHNGKNAASFAAHQEQAWYIAGWAAAQQALSVGKHRLGMIASDITPETVRYTNAYLLGARKADPLAVVEVQWMGFWYDYNTGATYPNPKNPSALLTREQLLAQRLVDNGAVVIGHQADDGAPARYIDSIACSGDCSNVPNPIPTAWAMGNDNKAACNTIQTQSDGTSALTGPAMKSCLGGPFINWTSLYVQQLEEIHRGTWSAGASEDLTAMDINVPLVNDPTSVANFQINTSALGLANVIAAGSTAVAKFVSQVAQAGPAAVFAGPYDTTGQRDKNNTGTYDSVQSVAAGEQLSDQEYVTMCWFAKGVIEKVNPYDPNSADQDAHVPDQSGISGSANVHPNGQWQPNWSDNLLSGAGVPNTAADGGVVSNYALQGQPGQYVTCQENE